MSELADKIHAALAALADSDRSLARFGAVQHGYQLAPPIEIDRALPDDLRTFVTTIGSAGAGPGYGFALRDEVSRASLWKRGIPIAHLGCGYAAVVSLDPDHLGEVWLDAEAIGVVRRVAQTFTAWYLDWLAGVPPDHVPPNLCAMPTGLTGYLDLRERQLELEPGALAGPALREALEALGPQSIEIAADLSLIYPTGTRVAPCFACVQVLETLAVDGLRPDVVRIA